MRKIYILHGWAYKTSKWQPFLNELEKRDIQPILLKIPGLTAPLDSSWTIDDYVFWLEKELKNEKDVILLGHSNGGRIVLNYARQYPNKIAHLLLIDCANNFQDSLFLTLKKKVFKTIAKTGKKFTSAKLLQSFLYKLAREHDYQLSSENMKITMLNLIESDKKLDLSKITVPTTIIWGAEDKTTPLTDGKRIHEKIKNSTLHIIKHTRHSPQFTHPKEVIEIIFSCLSSRGT